MPVYLEKHAVSAVGFILFEDVRIKEELCGQMDEIFQKHFYTVK